MINSLGKKLGATTFEFWKYEANKFTKLFPNLKNMNL